MVVKRERGNIRIGEFPFGHENATIEPLVHIESKRCLFMPTQAPKKWINEGESEKQYLELKDVARAFGKGLEDEYEFVSVKAIDEFCDLREFGLKKPGLGCGPDGLENTLVDMGGPPNMDHPARHHIYFDLQEVIEETFYEKKCQYAEKKRGSREDDILLVRASERGQEEKEKNQQQIKNDCLAIGAFAAGKLCVGSNAEGYLSICG